LAPKSQDPQVILFFGSPKSQGQVSAYGVKADDYMMVARIQRIDGTFVKVTRWTSIEPVYKMQRRKMQSVNR